MAEGTELAKYYVQIVPSAKGISGGIKEALGGDAEADNAGKSAGNSFISGLKKVFATAAVGKVLKDTIMAGADLEQSFGGLDTIYGNASESMKQFAVEAAASGISMNTYAEQAVSMGAALKNSLGNDTAKAAEKANLAIMDMADNAAKMGTDVESLQNAYTGFSRGNYTMLDNLSLGFAGTKEGMQSLLDKAQEISGIEYDIDSYADIVDAIHVVQTEMGIAGVASEEASTTISGSFGAMKASWQNFQALLTTGGNIKSAMSTLVDNAITFLFGNLMPAIGNIMMQLPSAIMAGLTNAVKSLSNTIATSNIQELGTAALYQFINGLMNDFSVLAQAIGTLLNNAKNWISMNGDVVIETGKEVVGKLLNGIREALPEIMAGAWQIVQNIANGILQNLPQILQTGITLMGKLLAGIINGIASLLAGLPQVVTAIVGYFKGVDWGSVGKNIIIGIKNGLVAAGHMLWDAVKNLLGSFKENVLAFFGIHSPSRWGEYVGRMIDAGFAGGITGNASMVQKAVDDLQTNATKPITTMLTTQAAITSSISASENSRMGQMLALLDQIANKDTNIILNNRAVNRSLREMGVAYI